MSDHDRESTSSATGAGASAEATREAVDQERVGSTGIPETVADTERAEGLHSVEEERQSGEAAGGPGGERYQALLEKRRREGLSDSEADELGRLMAEREGQTYSNARTGRHSEAESGPPG